jgi:hypothetical protein
MYEIDDARKMSNSKSDLFMTDFKPKETKSVDEVDYERSMIDKFMQRYDVRDTLTSKEDSISQIFT